MRILHLSSNIKFGGSEQQLIYLINATKPLGVTNFIFCFDTSILLEYENKIQGKILAVPTQKAYSKSLLKQLKTIVIEKNIDVIHIHNGKFVLTYMLTDLFYKLPCKAIFSKKDMSTSSSFLSKLKYNYKGIMVTTCVTEAIKNRFKDLLYKKNHHKLMVLRDGLNLESLQTNHAANLRTHFNISPDKIIIGNVANHVNAKDLNTLILMLDYLVNIKQQKRIHLLQIGRFTNATETFKALITEKKLDDYISFSGFIKNGYQFTSQFDIFVMSSQSEGLPLTILESFYYKIPVVSTNAGGIPEAITHKQTGMLAEIKDYKALGENVMDVLADPKLKTKITDEAYKLVTEKFTDTIMAQKTLAVYKSIIEN